MLSRSPSNSITAEAVSYVDSRGGNSRGSDIVSDNSAPRDSFAPGISWETRSGVMLSRNRSNSITAEPVSYAFCVAASGMKSRPQSRGSIFLPQRESRDTPTISVSPSIRPSQGTASAVMLFGTITKEHHGCSRFLRFATDYHAFLRERSHRRRPSPHGVVSASDSVVRRIAVLVHCHRR